MEKPRYSPTTRARLRTKIFRMMTSPFRVQPDFIIIGAQRSGTTSLFEYLSQHPQVFHGLYKEVRYFTDRYWIGPMFYRACFPTRWQMQRARRSGPAMTFEATPEYMMNPLALRRIKEKVPHVKLVAILRDPIERTLSEYRRNVRLGREQLSFKEAIQAEPDRIARKPGESDAAYYSRRDVKWFSYLTRSRYAPQLERAIEIFGKDRLHVMCFEAMIDDYHGQFNRLLDFLGLDHYDGIKFTAHHQGRKDKPDIADETLAWLREHFAPHNTALRDQFGDQFPWART